MNKINKEPIMVVELTAKNIENFIHKTFIIGTIIGLITFLIWFLFNIKNDLGYALVEGMKHFLIIIFITVLFIIIGIIYVDDYMLNGAINELLKRHIKK